MLVCLCRNEKVGWIDSIKNLNLLTSEVGQRPKTTFCVFRKEFIVSDIYELPLVVAKTDFFFNVNILGF